MSAGERIHDPSEYRLREVEDKLGKEGPFDVVVGINCKDVDTTIIHVLNVVCEGLQAHFPDLDALVVVCDGGSEDETVPLAEFFQAPRRIRKIAVYQAGGPGKGNGVRTILQIAQHVDAHACAFVDGDLVSIRPIWMDNLVRPVMHGLSDLVVPYYIRDKWDGVITNHLCYPFTAALYGSSVRQPIGGDFGVSRKYFEHLLTLDDFPGHFGVDIFLTTTAIAEGFTVVEAPLGIKVHASTTGYTDPRKTLSRMYLEVVGTLLDLAKKYETKWRASGLVPPTLLSENVISYYDRMPIPAQVNEDVTRQIFQEGVKTYEADLRKMLPPELFEVLQKERDRGIPREAWARIVYALAAWHVTGMDGTPRENLLHALGALGMGRFLRFVGETQESDLYEAHRLIQEQGHIFQQLRPDFLARVQDLRERVYSKTARGAVRQP